MDWNGLYAYEPLLGEGQSWGQITTPIVINDHRLLADVAEDCPSNFVGLLTPLNLCPSVIVEGYIGLTNMWAENYKGSILTLNYSLTEALMMWKLTAVFNVHSVDIVFCNFIAICNVHSIDNCFVPVRAHQWSLAWYYVYYYFRLPFLTTLSYDVYHGIESKVLLHVVGRMDFSRCSSWKVRQVGLNSVFMPKKSVTIAWS